MIALKKREILNLVFCRLAVVASVWEVQIKHLLHEGGSTNLNLHLVFEVPRVVYLNTSPLLGESIKKFVWFDTNNPAKGLSNGLQRRLVGDGKPRELYPNRNPKLVVIRNGNISGPPLENQHQRPNSPRTMIKNMVSLARVSKMEEKKSLR